MLQMSRSRRLVLVAAQDKTCEVTHRKICKLQNVEASNSSSRRRGNPKQKKKSKSKSTAVEEQVGLSTMSPGSDYFGGGGGAPGFLTPVVSYAPRPMLKADRSRRIILRSAEAIMVRLSGCKRIEQAMASAVALRRARLRMRCRVRNEDEELTK